MTVLMFGWEFPPPHISGGLGTACFGLTAALLVQDVRVLFVVPKAHGDESIPLINASEIVIGSATSPREEVIAGAWVGSKRIAIESSRTPYSQCECMEAVEEWNWQFDSESKKNSEKGGRQSLSFHIQIWAGAVRASPANERPFLLYGNKEWFGWLGSPILQPISFSV